jgi:hypothetical protein
MIEIEGAEKLAQLRVTGGKTKFLKPIAQPTKGRN